MIDETIFYGAGSFAVRAAIGLFVVFALVCMIKSVMTWMKERSEAEEKEGPAPSFPVMRLAIWVVVILAALGVWSQTFIYMPRASLNVPAVPKEVQERVRVAKEKPIVIEAPAQDYAPDIPSAEEVDEAAKEAAQSVVDSFMSLPDADQSENTGQ